MGGPSRSTRGREDAIETLIDMDPNGSAFRVAKTMVSIELYITFLLAVVCMSVMLFGRDYWPSFFVVGCCFITSQSYLFMCLYYMSSILYFYHLYSF